MLNRRFVNNAVNITDEEAHKMYFMYLLEDRTINFTTFFLNSAMKIFMVTSKGVELISLRAPKHDMNNNFSPAGGQNKRSD